MKFVVRGGVLAMTADGPGASVVAQVYAKVVSVEGGELRGVRAEEIYKVIVSPSGESKLQTPAGRGDAGDEERAVCV